jgi:hypothetical protein
MYRTVVLSILGRPRETIYHGDFETCKYVADRNGHREVKIVVLDSNDNWVYVAN